MRELAVLTCNKDNCIAWLRQNNLLARAMVCACGSAMQEKVYTRAIDGITWRCPVQRCRKTVNIRKGSFFERSHLSLTQLLDLIYWWSLAMSNAETEQQVRLQYSVKT